MVKSSWGPDGGNPPSTRQGRSQHRTTREGASGRSPTMQYRTERKRSAVRGVRTWGELANGSEAHIRRTGGRIGDGVGTKFCVLTRGDLSASAWTRGSHRGTNDEMTTRREESDGRVVPEGRRKAVPPARNPRGGKATTASEQAGQRDLFPETADSPQGAVPGTETGQPAASVRSCGAEVEKHARNAPAGDDDGGGGEPWKPDMRVRGSGTEPRGARPGRTEHRRGAQAPRGASSGASPCACSTGPIARG